MKLSNKQIENVIIVCVTGQIDPTTAPDLVKYFMDQLKKSVHIVADFSEVHYISSAGLRVLLTTVKEARKRGGDLRMAALQDDVESVLTLSGFDSFLKLYPDIDAAVESFSD